MGGLVLSSPPRRARFTSCEREPVSEVNAGFLRCLLLPGSRVMCIQQQTSRALLRLLQPCACEDAHGAYSQCPLPACEVPRLLLGRRGPALRPVRRRPVGLALAPRARRGIPCNRTGTPETLPLSCLLVCLLRPVLPPCCCSTSALGTCCPRVRSSQSTPSNKMSEGNHMPVV